MWQLEVLLCQQTALQWPWCQRALEVRGLLQTLWPQLEGGKPETGWGLSPAELQSPCYDHPLAGPRLWRNCQSFPYLNFRDLKATDCMDHSPLDLVPVWEAWGVWLGTLFFQWWRLGASGFMALRLLLAEICFLCQAWTLAGAPR